MDSRFFPVTLVPLSDRSAAKSFPLLLHFGQQLTAQVLAQTAPRQLLLEVNGHRLSAETKLAFKPGDRLRLEVVHTGPKPHLKVIAHANPALTYTLALRHALPRQAPLDQALQSFRAALDQPTLASPVRTQIEALLGSLPDRSALGQPDKLQAAIRLSGLFMEASAVASTAPLAAWDLKTRLLELAASIKTAQAQTTATSVQTPHPSLSAAASKQETSASAAESTVTGKSDLLPELAQQASGALARIVLDQLASLPKPDSRILTWQMEIPFRDGERLQTLRLTIAGGKQAKGDPAEPQPWTVDLEMEPPGLGQIRVRLVLQGERISSFWWGETQTTTRLLKRHLDTLAGRFRAVGLEPNHLQAVGELGADTRPAPPGPVVGPLLDEKI